MLKLILDILSVPAILVGLVAMVGLIAQKKAASEVVKSRIVAMSFCEPRS